MAKKAAKPFTGFSLEERRLRQRLLELNLRQIDVANALGIKRQDVCMVVRQKSRAPYYRTAVYDFLELEYPPNLKTDKAKGGKLKNA